MEKKLDIVALGELLIDFTEAGTSEGGMKLFEQNPGGAPANLLTVASHMGYKTAFIGKIGKDMHGLFLKKTLEHEGICTDYIIEDENTFTTLAFVGISEGGERQFSFARKPGADTRLSISDLDHRLLQSCKIFHCGSLSLTDEPARSATIEALRIAKASGALISYDPNYRDSLWENETIAIKSIKSVISFADIIKVSEEEGFFITGEKDNKSVAAALLAFGPKLVAITLGSEGVLLATEKNQIQVRAFPVEVIDTTGAGDSFFGGFLSKYLEFGKNIVDLTAKELKKCALYGHIVASLCVQKRGGIPAIPNKEEVENKIKILNTI